MYGEEQLNHNSALRYGWTKEFVEAFRALKYQNVEIPMTLIRPFHVYIQSYVSNNLHNTRLVNEIQSQHRLRTMGDVQSVLSRKPSLTRNLAKYPHRKTIVMPARFIYLALSQFSKLNVILMVSNRIDRESLKGKKLPRKFKVFDFEQSRRRFKITLKIKKQVSLSINRIISAYIRSHPIFSKKEFRQWLYKMSLQSIKTIHLLNNLIKKRPVGIMLDHVEIINPGATLAILAQKYKLPFLNIPQVMITDHSLIPTRASHYCMWGKHYKDWLQQRGIHPTKIHVVGNMRFECEQKASNKSMSRSKLLRSLNLSHLPRNQLLITYTTQTLDHHVTHTIMKWIQKVSIKKLPITFIIRPHPTDAFDYKRFLRKGKVVLSPKRLRLYDLLKSTDVVMTVSSNTAIEAAMFKKGIIVLQPGIPYDFDKNYNEFHAHLAKASAGELVNNKRQLYITLKKIVEDVGNLDSLLLKGQGFLRQTLQTVKSPVVLIRRLTLRLLKK